MVGISEGHVHSRCLILAQEVEDGVVAFVVSDVVEAPGDEELEATERVAVGWMRGMITDKNVRFSWRAYLTASSMRVRNAAGSPGATSRSTIWAPPLTCPGPCTTS